MSYQNYPEVDRVSKCSIILPCARISLKIHILSTPGWLFWWTKKSWSILNIWILLWIRNMKMWFSLRIWPYSTIKPWAFWSIRPVDWKRFEPTKRPAGNRRFDVWEKLRRFFVFRCSSGESVAGFYVSQIFEWFVTSKSWA